MSDSLIIASNGLTKDNSAQELVSLLSVLSVPENAPRINRSNSVALVGAVNDKYLIYFYHIIIVSWSISVG